MSIKSGLSRLLPAKCMKFLQPLSSLHTHTHIHIGVYVGIKLATMQLPTRRSTQRKIYISSILIFIILLDYKSKEKYKIEINFVIHF